MLRSNASGETGSTLIEVLVAMTIMATGVLTMSQLFLMSTMSNNTARNDTYATVLAEQKIEQLRSLAYGFDMAGLPVSDTDSNTAVSPTGSSGGTGLQPSPATALQENTVGWVDYINSQGAIVGNGMNVPATAMYIRRWSVEPLPTNPNNTIIIQVLVTPYRVRGSAEQGNVAKLVGEARMMTVKTRKAQ